MSWRILYMITKYRLHLKTLPDWVYWRDMEIARANLTNYKVRKSLWIQSDDIEEHW